MNFSLQGPLTLQTCHARRGGTHFFYLDKNGKKIQLNSFIDPLEEAKRTASKFIPPDENRLLLVGVGGGELALELLKDHPHLELYGLEACPTSAELYLGSENYKAATAYPNFKFLSINQTATLPFLASYQGPFFVNKSWMAWYEIISPKVASIIGGWEISKATDEKFGPLREANMMKNIDRFGEFGGVDLLEGLVERKRPALVVAAGPSLDECMEMVRRASLRGHTVIAVDAAFAPLVRAGVRVQIVVSTDPQEEVLKFFPPDCPIPVLVTTLRGTPSLLNLPAHVCLVSYPNSQPYAELNQNLPRGMLDTSGSVTSAAFDLAQKLLPLKIGLVGADFCYTSRLTHVKGSEAAKPLNSFHPKSLLPMETHDGKNAGSTHLLLGFRDHLSKLVQNSPIPVFNLSGGLSIPGATPMDPNKWI